MDDAPYPPNGAPDSAISHLFCKCGIDGTKRVRFAARIRRVDQVASLGETHATRRVSIAASISGISTSDWCAS